MSFNYTIKEHLVIKGNKDESLRDGAYVARAYIEEQLAALAGLMVLDQGYVIDLSLKTDGKEYKYEGGEVTPEFKKIISAIENAEELDLIFHYDFVHRHGQELCELAEPFQMMEYFEHPGDDMTGVFYSAWNTVPDNSENGITVAYGEHDGKKYNGEVEYKEAPEVPDGEWEDSMYLFCFDFEKDQNDAVAEITSACNEVKDLFSKISVDTFNGEFGFTGTEIGCHDATLHSAEDGEKLIALLKKALSYMKDTDSFEVCFFDTSSDDVRRMEITVNRDGEATILVSAV